MPTTLSACDPVVLKRGEAPVVPFVRSGSSPYTSGAAWKVTIGRAPSSTPILTLIPGSGVTVTTPANGPDNFYLSRAQLLTFAPGKYVGELWEDAADVAVAEWVIEVRQGRPPA